MFNINDPDFLRAVLDTLQAGVYVVDRHGKVLLWNSAAERMTGHLRQVVVGQQSPTDVLVTNDSRDNRAMGETAPLVIALKEGKPNTMRVSLLHKNGYRVPARLHTEPLRDAKNAIVGAVESFTEYQEGEDFLKRHDKLALYGCLDGVSGVLNHSMVQAHLREALVTFTEYPVPFSIMCIALTDVDHIRARHGVGAIDAILRALGQTMENTLRPTDFIGRWNQNEFLAILIECDESEAALVAQRVRQTALQCKVEWWGDSLPLNLSTGSATARQSDTVEKIIDRAEEQLRVALIEDAQVNS